MSKSIEELSAQRKLIQQHLDWLDAQIQQANADETVRYQTGEAAKISSAKPVPKNSRNQESMETTVPYSNVNTYDPIEAGLMKSSNASEIHRAQIGCFVIFTAVTLLFLFVLFVLPYLLD